MNSDETAFGDIIDKNTLIDYKDRYGKYLSILTPAGVSWGIFGVLIAITGSYRDSIFNEDDASIIIKVLFVWITLSGIFLGIIPLLIIFKMIRLPSSLEELTESRFTLILVALVALGIIAATVILDLPPLGVVLLILLSVPALISAWFAGEFYAVFTIRQLYKSRGWDYIEGEKIAPGIKGMVKRSTGILGLFLTVIAPILAINALISIFSKEEVREQGGPLGSISDGLIPPFVQSILVFLLLLGPLVSIATQPAGFLELTVNSEMYNTLSKFDWEEFNRKSAKAKDIISVKPYTKKVMAGILVIFLSFIMYISLLSIGGLISSFDLPIQAGFDQLAEALKFIEVPVLLFVIFDILRDLREEREVYDIANLGMKENRDVTGWTFWVLQNLYNNNYDEIERNLDELLEDPITANNHRIHFYKGLVYALQNDNNTAETHFERATELNPKYADSWMELGVVIYFQGRHKEALPHLQNAAKLKSKSKTIWYNIGRVYDVLNKRNKAMEAYQKALAIDKKDAKTWANFSGALIALKRYEEGIAAAKKAIEYDPSDYIAMTNLAAALQTTGPVEEYNSIVHNLLENFGDKTQVLQSLAHNKALENDFQGSYDIYQRIISLEDVNPFNVQGLSLVYSNLGLIPELVEIMENHVEQYQDDLHGRLLAGQAYLNVQRFEETIP